MGGKAGSLEKWTKIRTRPNYPRDTNAGGGEAMFQPGVHAQES